MPSSARPLGPLLKRWRTHRRVSQLSLALDAGLSARHLSFIETGRAKPSADVLLQLSEHLQVPLRGRNELLLAAGYAPRYSESPLQAPSLSRVCESVQRLLDAHDPFPGIAMDGEWNIALTNKASRQLLCMLPAFLTQGPINMFRASLHPEGLAALTLNLSEWGNYVIDQLRQLVLNTADANLAKLLDEVMAYPNIMSLRNTPPRSTEMPLLVPCVLSLQGQQVSMFTALTRLGSPNDITLSELSVELFYPSDEASEKALRALST